MATHTDICAMIIRHEYSASGRSDFKVLGLRVDVTSLDQATEYVIQRSQTDKNGYVCAANVHMCMESHDDEGFQKIVNGAALVVPDGKPLVWWMRAFGINNAKHVRGPDLFLSICDKASKHRIPIGLYGGTQDALAKLQEFFGRQLPALEIACAISPPFRKLTKNEKNEFLETINKSGAKILFLGLGCPKQERWMAHNKDRVNALMVGVGAAFDFYAGTKKIAPIWMIKLGLEWLYRLTTEPGRLWKRYLMNNPRFVFHFFVARVREYLNSLRI
jgi:N-acetylglucosaminyldiphosphoundecaprenol N-acetyl-beta-D-mannosaminyltransferase